MEALHVMPAVQHFTSSHVLVHASPALLNLELATTSVRTTNISS
jgi:hypothetical protein